jgi:hypothetical protein
MSSKSEDGPMYAYLRILNDNWPAVMRALGVDDHSKRGLRVQGGQTLFELSLLANSKKTDAESKAARTFFGFWRARLKKAMGPLTKGEKLQAKLKNDAKDLTSEEKAALVALLQE